MDDDDAPQNCEVHIYMSAIKEFGEDVSRNYEKPICRRERGSRCLLTIANAGRDAQPALLMATHRQQDAEVRRRGDDEGNGAPERLGELETLMSFLGGRHELRGGQADQVLQERVRIAEGEGVQGQAAGQA